MQKISGKCAVLLGTALILSALFLTVYNKTEDQQAGREAAQIVEKVIQNTENNENEPLEPVQTADTQMPEVEIDGYSYVGYLSIPVIGVELPVMAEWDYTRLKKVPCRQLGSSCADDLVIAAHNYRSHFGRLKELEAGDEVIFTDMDGIVNTYEVDMVQVVSPDQTEMVENSGYALVLYTCTYGGKSRVCVFCVRE